MTLTVEPGFTPPAISPLPVARRRVMLAILICAFVLSYLDRQIVTILAEPIKRELALADWQVGAITGLAFAVFYTGLGIPIALLAERYSRPRIIGLSMILWSAFTILCGQASSFTGLLLARIGVGFGEAGCNPSAHSLISDYVPREKRASSLALFSLGVPIGTLLGLGMGGILADAYGWRTAFLIAGLPGVVLGLVAAIVLPEPRQASAAAGAARRDAQPIGQTFKLLSRKPTFWLAAFGAAGIAFVGNGHGAFIAPFFLRAHGESLRHAAAAIGLEEAGLLGLLLGLAQGGGGLAGTLCGGWLADRATRGGVRGYAQIPAMACLFGTPLYFFVFLADNPFFALGMSAVASFFGSLWYGPVYTIAQSVVPPQSRPTAAAILIFTFSVIGLGLGPLAVGLLSDVLAGAGWGEIEGVRWALIASSAGLLIACPLFILASKTIERDIVS